MQFDKAIARCACVVDRSLRSCFPENYDARCMYAAFGMHALAKKMDLRSNVVAGDFIALSVAKDGSQATFQGYGKSDGNFAHYWCEIEGHLVDLGPMYLHVASRYPAAAGPVVVWPLKEPLPQSVRYRTRIRYHTDVEVDLAPDMMARLEAFLKVCEDRHSSLKGQPKMKAWLLSDERSIRAAARSGDIWAAGALRLASLPPAPLPL